MVDDTDLQAVRAGFAALQRGDPQPLIDLLHPEVEWHPPAGTSFEPCVGRQQAADVLRYAADEWAADIEIGLLVDADKIVVELRPAAAETLPDLPVFGETPAGPRLWHTVEMRGNQVLRVDEHTTWPGDRQPA